MAIDPRHLKIVLAVVEHGTFNKAAEALGISQPALSKSISLLEHAVGAKLFERGHRGASLTETGRIIARTAHNCAALLGQMQAEIRAQADRLDGPITLGATPSLMLGLIPEALLRLTRQHPRATIKVIEGLDSQLSLALDQGAIDLLVSPVSWPGSQAGRLVEIPLSTESLFVGVARDHRLAGAGRLDIRDLRHEPLVLPTAGSAFHRLVEALFIAADLPWPDHAITTNCLALKERLVNEAGMVLIGNHAQLLGRPLPYVVIPLTDAPRRVITVRHLKGLRLPAIADHLIAELQAVGATLATLPGLGPVGRSGDPRE